ncbi:MAG: hypothetical protein ACYC5L_03950, partial [Bellilinea sp.]
VPRHDKLSVIAIAKGQLKQSTLARTAPTAIHVRCCRLAQMALFLAMTIHLSLRLVAKTTSGV